MKANVAIFLKKWQPLCRKLFFSFFLYEKFLNKDLWMIYNAIASDSNGGNIFLRK